MQDSSPSVGLEDRCPACQLIAVIDDPPASSGHALRTGHHGRRTCGRWRLAGALRTTIGSFTPIKQHISNDASGRYRRTYCREKRAAAVDSLKELGMNGSPANPQAKGRIERLFGTCQDRLWKECV